MSFSLFQIYLRALLPDMPLWHWFVMGGISVILVLGLIWRQRLSAYRATVLGMAVFVGLYLLNALVLFRIGSHCVEHPGLKLGVEIQRFFGGNEEGLMLMLFNLLAFIPFGFFFSEYLVTSKFSMGHCLGYVALTSFGLSLCIESLQLLLRVGIFELTDLVLNTGGAVFGAAMSLGVHKILRVYQNRKHKFLSK